MRHTFLSQAILSLFVIFATSAKADVGPIELSMRPDLGYSDYYGLEYGLGLAADYSLSANWQIGIDVNYFGYIHGSSVQSEIGPTYNFSGDDLLRSFFVGAGVGYSNHYPYSSDSGTGIGYVRFGKRFLISEKYQITYKPWIEVSEGRSSATLTIPFLNFSILLP